VLHCAGWSLIFLSLFYLVIDVWRLRRWSIFFVVIGMNSITIYLANSFFDFEYTTKFFFEGALKHTGEYHEVLFATALVGIQWLLLYVLYRHKIFLRV
jgi:predicted acyltransferase